MKKNLLLTTITLIAIVMISSCVMASTLKYIVPSGSYASNWMKDGCSSNYQCVDDPVPGSFDDKAIMTRTNGITDLYRFSNIDTSADEIEYVQISITAQQWRYRLFWVYDKIRSVIKTEGHTIYGALKDLDNIAHGYVDRYYTNPVTHEAWTREEVNNLLAGVKSEEGGIVERMYISVKYNTCGDNVAEGSEVCDGTDLKGQTCESQGYIGGTLECSYDCKSLNTAGCSVNSCSDTDGYNLTTLGTVTGYDNLIPYEYTDYCVPSAGSLVVEYTCLPDGRFVPRTETCSVINSTSVCVEGVCV